VTRLNIGGPAIHTLLLTRELAALEYRAVLVAGSCAGVGARNARHDRGGGSPLTCLLFAFHLLAACALSAASLPSPCGLSGLCATCTRTCGGRLPGSGFGVLVASDPKATSSLSIASVPDWPVSSPVAPIETPVGNSKTGPLSAPRGGRPLICPGGCTAPDAGPKTTRLPHRFVCKRGPRGWIWDALSRPGVPVYIMLACCILAVAIAIHENFAKLEGSHRARMRESGIGADPRGTPCSRDGSAIDDEANEK